MSATFPNDGCRNCKIWQGWKTKAEQMQDERDALLTACGMVPRLLREIRGFASDLFGGESSLTDCIDLVLSETETAVAKVREKHE